MARSFQPLCAHARGNFEKTEPFTPSFTQSASMRPGEYAMCLQTGPNVDGVNDYVKDGDGMTVAQKCPRVIGTRSHGSCRQAAHGSAVVGCGLRC